jgi:hypothetical protein
MREKGLCAAPHNPFHAEQPRSGCRRHSEARLLSDNTNVETDPDAVAALIEERYR